MFKINEIVKIKSLDLDGIVKDLYPDKAKIAVKNSFIMVRLDDLQGTKIVKSSSGKAVFTKVKMKSNEIDLHGYTYEEAMYELDKFFNEAFSSNQKKIHIIHGNGKGVMKRAVDDTIEIYKNLIEMSYFAPLNDGGIGATRIILK